MKKLLMFCLLMTTQNSYAQEKVELAPNLKYVGGKPILCPDNEYHGGTKCILSPHGQWIGGTKAILCPDNTYHGGIKCMLTPHNTWVGVD